MVRGTKKGFRVGRSDVLPMFLDGRELVDIPGEIQLLPAGWVHSKKGDFLVDADAVREILAAARAMANDLVIDYEHQTLTGQEAPAAGWIKSLEDRGQDGLWGKVEWTPRAREYLTNREYRYLSPVILVRKSDKRVLTIQSAGLTNTPAIDGMVPIVNSDLWEDENMDPNQQVEMCRALLGLPKDASEDQALEAIRSLKGQTALKAPVAHKEVLTLLDLADDANLDSVKGKILALKNPSGYVRVEEFQTLKDRLALRDRDDLVASAISQGKVTPAQKTWAEEYALKDPAGFRAFVALASAVVPIGEVAGGTSRPAGGAPGGADEVQTVVNKVLGISGETFKKYGGEN